MSDTTTSDPRAAYEAAATPDNEAHHAATYGPCDAMAPGGRCYQCALLRGEDPAPPVVDWQARAEAAEALLAAAGPSGLSSDQRARWHEAHRALSAAGARHRAQSTPVTVEAGHLRTLLAGTELLLAEQRSRTEAAEAEAAVLRARLAEWEGDGGIFALQDLAAYFHESGNYSAWNSIRTAAHAAGWCIDSGGADAIDPVPAGWHCPLCAEQVPA